jgi:Ca-activated chloride channel family protein
VEKSHDESLAFIEKLWAMRRVGEIIDEVDLHGKNKELIDELVALSKKHGILTPYTSFLADETAPFRDLADSNRRASRELDALGAMPGGAGGFGQRVEKGMLQRANQAPAASSPAKDGKNLAKFRLAGEDKEVVVETVQNVGRKTFFYRNNRWTDSSLTEEQEKKAQKVQRYSQDYFDLITKHGKDAAKYLAVEGNVTFELGGQSYELVD